MTKSTLLREKVALRLAAGTVGLCIGTVGIVVLRVTGDYWLAVLAIVATATAGLTALHLANLRWNRDYRPGFPFRHL